MEVGHTGQSVSLQAIVLGLGTVLIGAFEDKEVKQIVGIAAYGLYVTSSQRSDRPTS